MMTKRNAGKWVMWGWIILLLPACSSSKKSAQNKGNAYAGQNTECAALLRQRDSLLAEMDIQGRRRNDSLSNSLKSKVDVALSGFKGDDVQIRVKNGKLYISMAENLLFRSGSASLDAEGKNALKKLSTVLNNNAAYDIIVEGHTDNVPVKAGPFKDNWDLSTARAMTIVRLLTVDYKVTSSRFTVSGKASFDPVAPNTTAEGRAKNRRTEFVIVPKEESLQ
jgi:chemotaxis protein MotB